MSHSSRVFKPFGAIAVRGVPVSDRVLSSLQVPAELKEAPKEETKVPKPLTLQDAGFQITQDGTLKNEGSVEIKSSGLTLTSDGPVRVNASSIQIEKTVVIQDDPNDNVSIDTPCGIIVTAHLSTAAGESSSFTVHNSWVAASSVIVISQFYSATFGPSGAPIASLNQAENGSFRVTIYNSHHSAPLNGRVKIHFLVV